MLKKLTDPSVRGLLVAVLATSLAGGCAAPGTPVAGKVVVVELNPGDAGQSGAATMTELTGRTLMVSIGLAADPGRTEEAGIYSGTCTNYGTTAEYPLKAVSHGYSNTTGVPTTLDLLRFSPHVIMVMSSASATRPCPDDER